MYQNAGKRRVWRREGSAHDLKHIIHRMVWAGMAANGTLSLLFIDDVSADKSTGMDYYGV